MRLDTRFNLFTIPDIVTFRWIVNEQLHVAIIIILIIIVEFHQSRFKSVQRWLDLVQVVEDLFGEDTPLIAIHKVQVNRCQKNAVSVH